MASIRELVGNLAVLIIIATLLEMLLPLGNLRNFVKMVMGLFLIVTVLNPVLKFIDQPIAFEITDSPANMNLDSILKKGAELQKTNQNSAVQQYEDKLAQQVLAVARLAPTTHVVNAKVEVETGGGQMGEIKAIRLKVGPPQQPSAKSSLVDPIRIETPSIQINSADLSKPVNGKVGRVNKQEIQKLQETVANFYSIPTSSVVIEE